jgi:hypothetical protein
MADEVPREIDYATPTASTSGSSAGNGRRMVACALGVVLCLFGVPFLIGGIVALMHWYEEPQRFYRSDDSYSGMIGLALGWVCCGVGARWIWYAWRGEREE